MPNHPGGATVRSLLALILALLVGAPPRPLPAAQREAPVPEQINVVIVEGDGAVNNTRQRVARDPVVRVEDEKHRPIAQAAVLFVLPETGPSGTFARGASTLLVRTDNAGRAVARGLRANEDQGKFQIGVQVSFRGATGTGSIDQVNATLPEAKGRSTGKLIAILAAVGAAAAAGAVVAARRGNTDTGSISISAGTPTVGGPQ